MTDPGDLGANVLQHNGKGDQVPGAVADRRQARILTRVHFSFLQPKSIAHPLGIELHQATMNQDIVQ